MTTPLVGKRQTREPRSLEPRHAMVVQGWARRRGAVSRMSGAESVVGTMGGLLGFEGVRRGISLALPAPLSFARPFSCSAPSVSQCQGHAAAYPRRFVLRLGQPAARVTCAAFVGRGEGVKAALTRAARLAAVEERDAHRPGLVGEVVGHAGAGEHHDANGQGFEELIVALERCRLGMPCPVRLEDDLGDLARVRPASGDLSPAPRGVPPWRRIMSECLAITLSSTAQMRW